MHKASKLLEDYQKKEGFKNFAEQQRVLDILTHKVNTQKQIKEEAFNVALMCLAFMVKGRSPWSKAAFENIKGYPMIIWIESIGAMESQHIMALLNNYHKELPSSLIETCIINLPENMQLSAIDRYYKEIDIDSDFYSNFYYSISDKARSKLKSYYPDTLDDDILLELQDLDETVVVERLSSDRERLMKLSSDDLIEFILLKATKVETLNIFLGLFSDKVSECSIPKFELLFTRYRYVRNGFVRQHFEGTGRWSWDDEDEKELNLFTDNDLFNLFKSKFHEIGIQETLSLFDHNWDSYSANEFAVDVVLEFLDIAHDDIKKSKYINDVTIQEIIKRFEEKCKNKDYSLQDLERLVRNIGKDGKTKLIFDDYIEAIIACGKLLKDKTINDKNPLFLELREKFTADLISRCQKDGTYTEDISLNGVFYRLAKGSMPFDKVYMTKTYRGLIYLSKCGQLIDNADYITNFLTDEQLVKLNITPVIRWKNAINRTNTNADNLSFIERMGLQLLCYFGRDRGKYLLESNMQGNRMENLFDGLKYADISINEDGTFNVPEYHNRPIQYGSNIKTICVCMNNDIYNSTDGIVRFISNLTNGGVTISKSTLLSWNKKLSCSLKPVISNIESNLKESYYDNCDDSSIKIDGMPYNDLCVCNDKYSRLRISEKKDRESWKKYTILSDYKGVIVKDGTDVFNGLGIILAQCCSHILRYIKGVYDFVEHKGAKRMDKFLKKCIHLRKQKIKKGIKGFTEEELRKLYVEFDRIFACWKEEWMKSSKDKNPVYDDERKLLARFGAVTKL